jgi:hypothetical protein
MSHRIACVCFAAFYLTACGGRNKTPLATAEPAKKEPVSVEAMASKAAETQAETPPVPAPAPPAIAIRQTQEPTQGAASPENKVGDAPEEKTYNRFVAWLRDLKFGDAEKKKQVLAEIRKANLSKKEMAQLETLRAHYGVQTEIR